MTLLRRLSHLVLGEDPQHVAFVRALRGSYVDCSRRAASLLSHAEMAPQEASARVLRQLAEEEAREQEELSTALRERGIDAPPVADEAKRAAAPSHWARLVQDLELHRSAVRDLQEFAVRFANLPQATGPLFASLCRREAAHCTSLRALIARADPRAID